MTAYYNEIDPKAAAWLRELIKRGLIADGDVDETDIRDVDPARLGGYAQCHFFAGIGGWSYALRLAGWPDDRPVWTGSCPCQPFSAAGRRAGQADERHLWPHWHHLISVCRPSVVFGEQVASKDGLGWLDLVCADLEGSGYAVGAADLCAAGVGAPHIRQRLWFVGMADASGEHLRRGLGQGDGASGTSQGAAWERQRGGDDDGRSRADGGLADAVLAGRAEGRAVAGDGSSASGSDDGGLADAEHGAEHWHARAVCGAEATDASNGGGDNVPFRFREADRLADASGLGRGEVGIGDHRGHDWRQLDADVEDGGLADADSAGRLARQRDDQAARHGHTAAADGDDGGLADARSRGSAQGLSEPKQWEEGRAGEHDDCGDQFAREQAALAAARPSPTDGHWRDADWLFCRDDRWRPVEPASQRMANGLSLCLGSVRRARADEKEEVLSVEERVGLGRKALRVLRESNGPEAFWLSVGGRIGFPQATFLLAILCEYSRELGIVEDSKKTSSAQNGEVFLRTLRQSTSSASCSPQRSECSEQLIRELGDALSKLSQDSAQHQELMNFLASYTAGPLANSAAARVGRLRGYGNAIVPPLAATFIRSVM